MGEVKTDTVKKIKNKIRKEKKKNYLGPNARKFISKGMAITSTIAPDSGNVVIMLVIDTYSPLTFPAHGS